MNPIERPEMLIHEACFRLRPCHWAVALSVAVLLMMSGNTASADNPQVVTYLLPAPKEAISFAPFVLAEQQGWYRDQGLQIHFVVVQGGAKVGEALSRGEGDLGGALGDTAILLRERGLAVKGVALLGGHAFLTLMTDRQSHVSLGNLRGKRIDVPSFEDVSYYALEAMIRSASLSPSDLLIQAHPAAELWQELGQHHVDGIVGTVDWGVKAERAGVVLDWISVDRFLPAMAQAIMASDATIAAKPDTIRKFVGATLRAVVAIQHDPRRYARIYHAAMPGSEFTVEETERLFTLLGAYVYAGQRLPGAFDSKAVEAMQQVYLDRKLITSRRDAADFYTNRFIR